MPKITNKDYTIAGKKYNCSVWYTATDKFFLKDFPKDVERTAHIVPFGSKTEDELYQRYKDGISQYEDIITQCKKVIIFRMSAAKPHIEDKYKRNENPTGIDSAYGYHMGFLIEYEVKLMRTVGDAYYLHAIGDNDKPVGSGNKIENKNFNKIIDYTPEREAAFKELYTRFDKMFMAFTNGFDNAEKFIDAIPSTKLLT